MKFIREFYRAHIKNHFPRFLRKGISKVSNLFRKKDILSKQTEWALKYWNDIWKSSVFPYPWANEYESENFLCEKDVDSGLFFVESRGLKLYFPRNYEKEKCQNNAIAMCLEQDLRSAHRYVSKENKMFGALEISESEIPKYASHFVKQGDIVADIGASCGNFSLGVIENAKHIYLFEAARIWNEPLRKTFERYKDKITIVNKYVSDADSEDSITLDTFFKNKEVNFIKADVDGYEQKLLNGAKRILQRENMKCSICTYHRPQDEKDFERFFRELGYETDFSDSYMFFPIDEKCFVDGKPQPRNMSFFRKGVLMTRKGG